MTLGISYRPDAQDDLKSLFDYLAGRNASLARGIVDDLLSRCDHLARFPDLGVMRDEYGVGTRLLVVQRRHVVIDQVVGETVEILRVFGAGQDYANLLSQPPG